MRAKRGNLYNGSYSLHEIATANKKSQLRNDGKLYISVNQETYMKKSHMYMMADKNNTVIYTGSSSNLVKRVYQHKTKT